jgi:hypothetical protein
LKGTADFFAMVRRDELWVRGALSEIRSGQGQASHNGNEIVARDVIEDRALRATLSEACDAEMERVRLAIAAMRDARVRGVVTASIGGVESTVTITIDGISVVSTPASAAADHDALRRLLGPPTAPPPTRRPPVVWRNGSAAVLLHEAIGHAAEHEHAPIDWPRWLTARDVTPDGRSSDLIAGERPAVPRRESFRDIPIRRMSNLVIEHNGAPFEVPHERIEVHLAAGGAYEPLTETVTVTTAVADLMRGDRVQRLPPMHFRATRSEIARALRGATAESIRYPGVICSREGQELFVASHAPVMITAELP